MVVELAKRARESALQAVEHNVLFDAVCLEVVFKVAPLNNGLVADGAVVTDVVGERNLVKLG